VEQVPEACVRLLGRAEAGELPHRPELAAVHRGVDPARERIDPGVAEIAVVVDAGVVRRVERLVLEPRDRREELTLTLGCRVVEFTLPLGGRIRPRARILGGRHLVPLPVLPLSFWVATIKPEAAPIRSKAG